jgi:hypothetical protein
LAYGITVKQDTGGARIELRSQNQAGLLYAVPAEASWVATAEQLPAHALAGFLSDLTALDDPQVRGLMSRWGLYFRPLPLDDDGG